MRERFVTIASRLVPKSTSNQNNCHSYCFLLPVLFEDFDHLGYFIIASQPDWSAFMDGFRNLFQHSALAIECETTCFLNEFGHGETFVQQTKFATGRLAVGGIGEDSPVK